MRKRMPKRVVIKAPFVGENEYAEVPDWDDLGKKADRSQLDDVQARLNGKAEIAAFDRLGGQCREIAQSLGEKVDKKAAEVAVAQLVSEIEKGKWHDHFKQFVESQTRRFESALEVQHGRFDHQLEAFRKETGVASELPARIQQAVENHRQEMAGLLESFTKALDQKAREISSIHQACMVARDDMQREAKAIQALQGELTQAREISTKTATQFKTLEAINAKIDNRLDEFLKLKQQTESIYAACQEVQNQLNATGESIEKHTKDAIEARNAAAKDAAAVRAMMAGCGTFVGRFRWLFCGRPNHGPINTTTAQ
jgi:chromosome segregation ATPase